MSLLRRFVAPAILSAGIVLLSVGCGALPNAPQVTPGQVAPAQVGKVVHEEGLIGGLTDLLKGLIVKTLNLVGSLGGTVTNGRWKVVIPAGAIDGSATVYVGVQSSTSPIVQLEINPEKNSFLKPVTLTADCSSVSATLLKTYSVFWWDPVKSVWVPVPGSKVDLTKKTVTAPLYHFSKYSVGPLPGKGGW